MAYLQHPIVADDMYGGKVVYDWQIADRDPQPAEPLDGPRRFARMEARNPPPDFRQNDGICCTSAARFANTYRQTPKNSAYQTNYPFGCFFLYRSTKFTI